MHYWNLLWDWNTLDSVRAVHSFLEGWALVFFALLVLFDVLAHVYDERLKRAKICERIGLWCFGVAVLAEILAYPYGQHNDTLSGNEIVSLSDIASKADKKARQAMTDSSTAISRSSKASDASGKALVESGEATAMASNGLRIARGAREEADSFERDIVSAKKDASEAKALLSEVRTLAAEAKTVAARVADKVADRVLTPGQLAGITARMRVFGPMRVDVLVVGDPPEIEHIANALLSALQGDGWTLGNSGKAMGGPAITGILIGTKVGSSVNIENAANALIIALRSSGIASNRFIPQFNDDLPSALTGTWDTKNNAQIRILVGAKP